MCLKKPLHKLIKEVKPSIGVIGFSIRKGKGAMMGLRGTTFCVAPSYFVSAFHVYNGMSEEEKRNLKIWIPDLKDKSAYIMYDAEFTEKDESSDSIIIKLLGVSKSEEVGLGKEKTVKPLLIGNSNLEDEGKEVFFSGFPTSPMKLSPTRREVSFVTIHAIIATIKKHSKTKDTTLFFLDTNCDKGFSGSPLFSSESGRIIGFISGRFAKLIDKEKKTYEIVGLGIARPINPVKKLLKNILS